MLKAILSTVSCLVLALPAAAQCPGDVAQDGIVNGTDLAAVLGAWGTNGQGVFVADINGDGIVEGADLAIVLGAWGTCPPVVASISPNFGTIVGGTPVTITGAYFSGTSSVTFGTAAATQVSVVNSTTLTAVTPSAVAGPVAVSVTANGRTGTLQSGFSYSNSEITGVVPNTGAAQGGGLIAITGVYLSNTTGVWFGQTPALSFTQVSATQVNAVAPAGSVGTTVDIRVQTPAGLLTAPSAFSYFAIQTPAWATLIELLPNPAVVYDEAQRDAINATGLAWRVKDTATQIEMLMIPPGTFNMGCSASNQYACSSDEYPVHQVTLSAFYLGRYEVTQAQWQATMGSNPSYFAGYANSPSRPVERVSWNMIQGFLSATGMRLPTESEWEYAYRAGTATAYHGWPANPSGTNDDNQVGNIAWYLYNTCWGGPSCSTQVVGLKFANGFGLHDMGGNVFEWVNDWWGYYSADAQTNPQGPSSGSYRVLRANTTWGDPTPVSCSHRRFYAADTLNEVIGFRVARTP